MRIRLKLSAVELTMALGFVVAISISLFYLNSMVRVKNMEYQGERVVSSLSRFSNHTEGFLISAKSLSELKNDWNDSILQFESEFQLLKDSNAVNILGEERFQELSAIEGSWNEISQWHIQPVFDYIDIMISNGFEEKLGSIGILQALYSLEENNSDLADPVMSLTNYRNNIERTTVDFSARLGGFINSLRSKSDIYIQDSLRIVLVIVILTILISLLIINITARKISLRIGMVDDAVQVLTQGDFSKNLIITSGDEFEELANHYNTFKGELWRKLDSILEFMLQIGDSISEGVDIHSALQHVLDSFIKNTTANAGAVFMVDENQQFIDLIALNGFFPCPFEVPSDVLESRERQTDYLRKHPITIGKTIIGQAIKTGKGVYLKEAGTEDMLRQNRVLESIQYIHSMAVIPLIISKRVLGAVALVKTSKDMAFTDMEFTNMKTFGDYAALTIDNMYNFTEAVQRREMERELRIASDIQKNLLPKKIPDIKGFSIGIYSEAARAMSGDYYDIYRLDKNKIALVICDVVGKGVPASLLMVMIRTIIRFISSPKRGADQILNVLNKGLTRRIGTDQYATLSLSVIDEDSGMIDFSNAGHSPMLYYNNKEGVFSSIDTKGLPVGVETEEIYVKKSIKLESNDIVILYTDGLPETRGEDGSLYSLDTLQKLIIKNKAKPVEKIVDIVENDIRQFKGSQDLVDDQTLLIVKAN
ncbi:MAG: SpoIIE family protein phosphatase [Spirochaetia bacterium]|jgi:sigma-B regulation protein RsbU (phosphoserine phosphatase)|nr:SpoIIE family protein phosphatase [Spirochaetia bacterium]